MKVTTTKCLDGKRHRWLYLVSDRLAGMIYETKWCKNCGSVTEFYSEHPPRNKAPMKRCKEPDGSYYIMIPAHLQ